MKISFGFTKKDIVRIAVCGVLAAVGIVFAAKVKVYDCITWFLILFVLSLFTYVAKSKIQAVLDIVLPLFASAYTVYFMQLPVMVGSEYVTEYKALYPVMYHFESMRFVFEFSIVFAVYFFLRIFIRKRAVCALVTPILFLLYGTADYFVYQFRGHELNMADIASIRTAMNVAGNFSYPLLIPAVFVVLPFALYCVDVFRVKGDKDKFNVFARIAVCLVLSVFFGCFFVFSAKRRLETNKLETWERKGSTYNGIILNAAYSAYSLFPEAPDGYSAEDLNSETESLGVDLTDEGKAGDDTANIIVVMNESYMQAADYIYMLGIYEDPTPYWNSLTENCVHGYAFSSVYAGNTANTEYEFLTGLSMAFMPNGTVPYSIYIEDELYALPWALSDLGYDTLAMHPYLSSGWNRTKVYPLLGFDDYMFLDEFEYDDSDLIREYVSDSCAYRNLISTLEQKEEGQKIFTFLITMQNHGGYTEVFDNFTPTVYSPGIYTGETTEVNTYLSLLKESDKALEELITYLSAQDEKYVLLMFGDHQPGINAFANNFSLGRNSSYSVPYIIWTNYDMPEGIGTSENTSINYLALDVMAAAGIEVPAYYQLLTSIREDIPAINTVGYLDAKTGEYVYFDDIDTYERNSSLALYADVEYNAMFDEEANRVFKVSGN